MYVQSDIEQRRPLFDSLAWILILAIFCVLAWVVTLLHDLTEESRNGLLKAAQERAEIRIEATKQRIAMQKDLDDLHGRLTVAPSDVMKEVKEIKQMLSGGFFKKRNKFIFREGF